jgi:hypothetical protein
MIDSPSSDPGASSAAGADNAPLPSLPARIVQVFVSPGALFDRLKETPVWLGALLVVAVVSLAINLLMPEEILRQLVEAQMPADTPPEAVDQGLQIARITGYFSVVVTALWIAIVAGVIILIYNVFLGGNASFKQWLSAVSHAFLIMTAGSIITFVLMRVSGQPTTLSLNLLIPGLEEGYLFRLLSGIGVFGLWTAAVLGIAVSRIYPKRSAGSAAALLIGLSVVMTAIFAMFGGG